jgi:hypothetical protein
MLPPPGKHWQYAPEKLDGLDARGEIYWSPTGNPRRKIYADDRGDGIPVQDIWLDLKDAHNQNIPVTGYPSEKNVDLLRRVVRASSDEGDIVLDCFCGSGTTPVAAQGLRRRWIAVDNSEEAVSVTERRLLGMLPEQPLAPRPGGTPSLPIEVPASGEQGGRGSRPTTGVLELDLDERTPCPEDSSIPPFDLWVADGLRAPQPVSG